MRHIKLNEQQLIEILTQELVIAEGFEWTGWRIPIYVESDGSFSSGEWLPNNSWQPDAIEVPVHIERWLMSDLGYDEFDNSDVNYEAEEAALFHVNQLKERIVSGEMWNDIVFELVDH